MLKVDFREDTKIVGLLTKKEIIFKVVSLEVGDYLFENKETNVVICFERKTVFDFVGSVYSGRLFKQLDQMEHSYEKTYLIIVGDWKQLLYNKHQNFSVNQKIGTFASIAARRTTKFIQVDNESQCIDLILKICEKSTDGKILGDDPYIKRMQLENTYMGMLCAFPLIAEEKARKIIERYSTLNALQKALQDGQFAVSGIGEKTQKSLEKVLLE